MARREVGGLILSETVYPPHARIPTHSHAAAYLCYVRRGGYREAYGGRVRECGPQTVAFHPGGEEHAEEFGNREVRSFNVELPTAFVAQYADGLPLFRNQADFRGEPLAGIARQLYREFCLDPDAAGLAVQSLVLELLSQGVKQMQGVVPAGVPRWLERTREMVHDRFLDRLALEELAREAGVHPVYLASAFRRHYGSSVGEYVRRLRVEFAARQLESSAAPLADVAAHAGFADQAHFTRVFKNLTGLTPGVYRAQRLG